MSALNSTSPLTLYNPQPQATTPAATPGKPYPGFPLFRHASGQWAKKIRGKLHYFGTDADAALAKYLAEKDALHAGRAPKPDPNAVAVKDVANHFLNAKQALLDTGELSPRTWADYKKIADLNVKEFGKTRLAADLGPDDFAALRKKMAKRWGPEMLGSKLIQYTRCLYKHAYDAGLLDRPLRFGPGFKRPSKKTMRLHKAKQGPKLFTPEEIHRLLGAASSQVKAMILLGINCGFGNSDVGNLPLSALDLDAGMINFPRPKTGIARRCPLWAETVEALRAALASRPTPKDDADAGLLFVTKYGWSWAKDTSTNPLSQEIRKLLRKLEISGRKGLGFYTLRHVFETVGGEAKDQIAVDHIMGHADDSMAGRYRETISDARLRAVTDYVRTWLFAGDVNSRTLNSSGTAD